METIKVPQAAWKRTHEIIYEKEKEISDLKAKNKEQAELIDKSTQIILNLNKSLNIEDEMTIPLETHLSTVEEFDKSHEHCCLLLEELKRLRELIIKQNQLGATWHADIFGELMACLASSNQLIQQIEGKEDGQEGQVKT